MTKTLSSFLLPCHAELAEASLYLKPFNSCFFWETALCHAFLLRCNAFPLLFGKCIACIAMHVGITMVLQLLRPYGAGSVVRCSWNYCHVERKRNISWGRLEILRYAQDDKWSHSCKLLVVHCSWDTTSPQPFSIRGEWSGRSKQWHKSLTRQWVGGGTWRWA